MTPAIRRALKSKRVVQDADGALRLRGPVKVSKTSGSANPNTRVVMTDASAALRPTLVQTTALHDRAHQVMDFSNKLIPAARTKHGRTRVLVEEAQAREYPEYYASNVHEDLGFKYGATFEDQMDALHERRLALEGIPGIGYERDENAGDIAFAWLNRFGESQKKDAFDRIRSNPCS